MGDQATSNGENNRCRVKLSMNAKGLYQLEATAEFDDPAVAATKLIETLNQAREAAAANGYQLVTSG